MPEWCYLDYSFHHVLAADLLVMQLPGCQTELPFAQHRQQTTQAQGLAFSCVLHVSSARCAALQYQPHYLEQNIACLVSKLNTAALRGGCIEMMALLVWTVSCCCR